MIDKNLVEIRAEIGALQLALVMITRALVHASSGPMLPAALHAFLQSASEIPPSPPHPGDSPEMSDAAQGAMDDAWQDLMQHFQWLTQEAQKRTGGSS